jgi:hypothetical protein
MLSLTKFSIESPLNDQACKEAFRLYRHGSNLRWKYPVDTLLWGVLASRGWGEVEFIVFFEITVSMSHMYNLNYILVLIQFQVQDKSDVENKIHTSINIISYIYMWDNICNIPNRALDRSHLHFKLRFLCNISGISIVLYDLNTPNKTKVLILNLLAKSNN